MTTAKVTTLKGQTDKKITCEVLTITPATAKKWLEKNKTNRRISEGSSDAYARDMANGDWVITTDAIGFDGGGNLTNGQHRLNACVRAGVPFNAIVVYGLPKLAQRFTDCGRARSLADELGFLGHSATIRTGAAARWLYNIKHRKTRTKERVTRAELWAIIDRHPRLGVSAAAIHSNLAVSPSLVTAVHYIGCELLGEREITGEFIQSITYGGQAYPKDAGNEWRTMMAKRKIDRVKVPQVEILMESIYAWNCFRRRTSLTAFPEVTTIDGLDLELI